MMEERGFIACFLVRVLLMTACVVVCLMCDVRFIFSATVSSESVQLGDGFPPPERAKGGIADVVVFKNGYAFVRRYYLLEEGDTLRIGEVPNAAFGTFFALAEVDKAEVISVRTEFVEAQREVGCSDIRDVVLANVGKRLKFGMRSGNAPTVVGVLRKVLVAGGEGDADESQRTTSREETVVHTTWDPYWWYYPWWRSYSSRTERTLSTVASQPPSVGLQKDVYYAVETSEGLLIINSADVASVLVIDDNPQLTFKMKGRAKQLTIQVRRKMQGPVVIAVVYLVKGLNWIPSYRLVLSDDEKASFIMTGIIENDLGELRGARIRLAAGVPHFLRQEHLCPLTLENVVASGEGCQRCFSFQRQVFYGARGREWLCNASQVAGDFRPIQQPSDKIQLEDTPSGYNEDLFLYDCGVLDLAAGARVKLLLRAVDIKCRDLYVWEYDFDRAAMECYSKHSGRDLPAIEEKDRRVWHVLVLENSTDFPWSTGVATVFKNGLAIAQERLTYTPPGSQNELRLTVATNIMNRSTEEEFSRVENQRLGDGYYYTRVNDRIIMTLTNLKREPVKIRVKRWVYGTVDKVEDAKVTRLSRGEMPKWWYSGWYWGWWLWYNPFSTVEWEVELKPGECKTLTVERHYFFR